MEIVNKLVYAEPENQEAKDLLADIFEQIGYQQESPSVRNSFLAAAFELRNGIKKGESAHGGGPDMIRSMPTGLWLDYLAIRLDSSKVKGLSAKTNLITPDNNEKYVIELSNETLSNIKGYVAKDADLTITINREDQVPIMMGVKTFDDQIKDKKATFEGDREAFDAMRSAMVNFDMFFEIMPGTRDKKLTQPEVKPLQVDENTLRPKI